MKKSKTIGTHKLTHCRRDTYHYVQIVSYHYVSECCSKIQAKLLLKKFFVFKIDKVFVIEFIIMFI